MTVLADRDFDIGVVGASGYTGRLLLLELASYAPASLRLCASSRQPQKLSDYIDAMKKQEPALDRFQVFAVDTQLQDTVLRISFQIDSFSAVDKE
jgi:short subunit dehydrogenase-like uncharacterized protein